MMSNDDEFNQMIPGVKRLRNDRVNIYQQRQQHVFVKRPQEIDDIPSQEQAVLSGSARSAHFNPGLQKKLQRKIRQGQIRPEDSLDLHGYRQAEAIKAIEQFIDHAQQSGCRMVVIIHGQGYRSEAEAVLKPLVQRWLANCSEVLAWCPAQPRDGAGGASYVYLRSA